MPEPSLSLSTDAGGSYEDLADMGTPRSGMYVPLQRRSASNVGGGAHHYNSE
jgi:hypothetical protein